MPPPIHDDVSQDRIAMKRVTVQVRFDLTDDQIRRKGLELARTNQEIVDAEVQKAAQVSHYKGVIEGLKTKECDVRQCINNGYEMRGVTCEEMYNLTTEQVDIVRLDTGETVSSRTPSNEERAAQKQTRLFR